MQKIASTRALHNRTYRSPNETFATVCAPEEGHVAFQQSLGNHALNNARASLEAGAFGWKVWALAVNGRTFYSTRKVN
jgi:hypothetical protein